MVKRTGPTNVHLRKLIRHLEKTSKENKAKIWNYVAKLLSRPTRRRVEVNLGKIDKLSKENDIILVPGKVLGSGNITKKITIVAWKFSESAKKKLKNTGIRIMKIEELIKENPKGSKVRIVI